MAESLDIGISSKSRRIDGDRRTLAIDIGGTLIKTAIVDEDGALISEFVTTPTPKPATPEVVIALIARVINRCRSLAGYPLAFPASCIERISRPLPTSGLTTGKILTS